MLEDNLSIECEECGSSNILCASKVHDKDKIISFLYCGDCKHDWSLVKDVKVVQ